MFIATVRKYTRAKELTPRMLNELIECIEVHQAEKIDGKWEQRLTIHYNCVGAHSRCVPAARTTGVCKYEKRRNRQLRPIHHRRMNTTKKASVLTAFQML